LSEAERVQLKRSSFKRAAVENWVESWMWQSEGGSEEMARKELDFMRDLK
jgi:hypothetical protein